MFNRHSIKFKLFTILTIVILSFIVVFSLFWLHNTHQIKTQIASSNQLIVKESTQKNEIVQKEASEKSLEEYFKLVAQIVALDAYNLDYDAIQSKIANFLDHESLCTLEITDNISKSNVATAMRNCISKTVLHKEIPIFSHYENIASLKVGYSLEYIDTKIKRENDYLTTQSHLLQQKVDESFSSYFYAQGIIFFLLALGMLTIVWYQIDRTVVKPIETLLHHMETMEGNESATFSNSTFSKTEIGQLSEYFHKHIGKLITQLHVRANFDSVTKLYSKQKLLDDLGDANNHTLAILDLENFKEANNFFGVDVGDEILRYAAKHLVHSFDEPCFRLYRLHSDEFAIVATHHNTFEEFLSKLQLFASEFSNQEFNNDGTHLSFNVSIGLTPFKENPVKSMTCALIALKHAKNSKEILMHYSDELPIMKEYEKNIYTLGLIKEAIKENGVIPYFQPIFSHKEGAITQYEALMRINYKGSIIPPFDFLDVSKKSNTYRHLSEQMVMKVISHLKRHPSDTIAINITANDITRKEFCTWLLSIIEQSHLGHRITFEITEQEGIENFDVVKEFIAEAKRIGIKIAIDDFGSGYSNFEHLIHLHVDYLKIDGSLIQNIDKDENAQLIVKTIVAFSQALHIKTIAEYVSSEEIFNHVKALGIDYSQGYFIGKPEPKTL